MKTRRTLLTTSMLAAVLGLTGGAAYGEEPLVAPAAVACLPGIGPAFQAHAATYTLVLTTLQPQVASLQTLLGQVSDQTTYAALLTQARSVASSIANGRLLVSVPDGTVVLDTAKPDDPNNTLPEGNSYQHFQSKTVNENHNSRVAIFTAQEYPCGLGIESKLSTTTGVRESYVALRLGSHLDSVGTARLSTR